MCPNPKPWCNRCHVNTHQTSDCTRSRDKFRKRRNDDRWKNPSIEDVKRARTDEDRQRHESSRDRRHSRSRSRERSNESSPSRKRSRERSQPRAGDNYAAQGQGNDTTDDLTRRGKVVTFANYIELIPDAFDQSENFLEKFVVDSGATDHLSNSQLVFTKLQAVNDEFIECANKSKDARIAIKGKGTVKIDLNNGKELKLNNVIYAEDLSKNLLSLRKFVESGLTVFLDNKIVNIVDPKTNEIMLSGLYKEPFLEIELRVKTDKSDAYKFTKRRVNIATRKKSYDSVTEPIKLQSNPVKPLDSTVTVLQPVASDANSENIDSEETPVIEAPVEMEQTSKISNALLWHMRLAHASADSLKALRQNYPNIDNLKESEITEAIKDCEICFKAQFKRLPFSKTRQQETVPLKKMHADVMGPISPSATARKYRLIVSFIDSFSRYVTTYAIQHKSDVPDCLRDYIISCRNLCGKDHKFCFLECDQGTEFTGQDKVEVLKEFNAELLTVCPATPQHNGVAERFNQTIQKNIRAFLIDSRLPDTMWDLALGAATYVYNFTSHKKLDLQSPIKTLIPDYSLEVNQLKRFGCVAYVKSPKEKVDNKFAPQSLRTFLVGYIRTDYLLFHPESGRIFESRNVKFVEKSVYGDVFAKSDATELKFEETESSESANKSNDLEMERSEGVITEPQVKESEADLARTHR